MRRRTGNYQKKNHNLRLKSLDYSKNKNSFWRFEIFKNFNSYFKIDQFEANLEQISQLIKRDKRYKPFFKFYSHYWNIYKTGINNFNDFYSDSGKLLSGFFPFAASGKKDSLSFKKIEKLVKNHSLSSTKNWVIVGDDHRISHATIKELKRQNKTKVSVVVIDNHTDIYGPKLAKNNPLKFNPFRNLIESGIIEHVFFLCPSFKELFKNRSSWADIKKNISLIPIVASKEGIKFNHKKFETVFKRVSKQKSIKNIFFSIDVDALCDYKRNILYSAFEYSILNSILYLSLLSREQVCEYKNLSVCSIKITKVFHGKNKFFKIILIRNPYKPGLNTVNETGITSLMYCDIIRKVTKISQKLGLIIGLGFCVGEVVELMGPDWKGKTTKATIQIINFLNSLS